MNTNNPKSTNPNAFNLFKNWNEALIWSCVDGCMGYIIVDNVINPTSAIIDVGDFCFLAGEPSLELLSKLSGSKILVPKDKPWEELIELSYGQRADKITRYAIKKEPNVFNKEKLQNYIDALDSDYEIRLFDKEIYEMARKEEWSADLCSQFENYEDYKNRALGVAILHQGKLASGASPYAVYSEGIEIEIDTCPEYRGKGLATVCGAKLILECLERKIYPSWDAHDLRSVHLAEKLGYHLDSPYVAYELEL